MNDAIVTVTFAIEGLVQQAAQGHITAAEARQYLSDFGGIPHTTPAGEEQYLFVGLTYDVVVITDGPQGHGRCFLWKTMSPD